MGISMAITTGLGSRVTTSAKWGHNLRWCSCILCVCCSTSTTTQPARQPSTPATQGTALRLPCLPSPCPSPTRGAGTSGRTSALPRLRLCAELLQLRQLAVSQGLHHPVVSLLGVALDPPLHPVESLRIFSHFVAV